LDIATITTMKTWGIIITVVAGIVVVIGNFAIPYLQKRIDDHQQRATEQELARQLKETGERTSTDIKGVQTQLEKVQSQLEPFIALARQRFPGLDVQEALQRLQGDLKRIEELATRDIPKPPSSTVSNDALTALRAWKIANPMILVAGNLGNADTPNAEAVFGSVAGLLKETGILFEYRMRAGMTAGRQAPIVVKFHPLFENHARGFIAALSGYVQGETRFLPESQRKQNEIEITFVGIPKFLGDGRVTLE
jgi:CheY-like chemotaxis protein